jgi:hypothetical protein
LEYIDISHKDYARFLEEKLKTPNCPLCDNLDWEILNEPGKTIALFIEPDKEVLVEKNISLTSTTLAFGICCRNCGHLRLVARHIVAAWLQQKSVKESADEQQ